jgi:RNA polymerase sigma-70 factor (ECF subfamily)
MPDVATIQVQNWVKRIQAGDSTARDELLRAVLGRLETLAHQMMRGFPVVKRWAETDDVLQNALMRLMRALESVEITSIRDFYGLAATQIRRELIDLARQCQAPLNAWAHFESPGDGALDVANPSSSDAQQWALFHEEVEKLPAAEREVVSLMHYHGWSQAQVAELFNVHVRTVRRWWLSALLKLGQVMKSKSFVG